MPFCHVGSSFLFFPSFLDVFFFRLPLSARALQTSIRTVPDDSGRARSFTRQRRPITITAHRGAVACPSSPVPSTGPCRGSLASVAFRLSSRGGRLDGAVFPMPLPQPNPAYPGQLPCHRHAGGLLSRPLPNPRVEIPQRLVSLYDLHCRRPQGVE